jgi:hypothetical protein
LVGERTTREQPEEPKYYWSNLPASATVDELAGYAHRRSAVEQLHEEAKGELGWDQDQGRLWPGFHPHAVTVMLADSFLVGLELWPRRAPRRRGAPATRFPPRPDRHRRTLPAVHREVARWLRHQAVHWWVATDRFMELCSQRI